MAEEKPKKGGCGGGRLFFKFVFLAPFSPSKGQDAACNNGPKKAEGYYNVELNGTFPQLLCLTD
jgi:hypothetical protein